MNKNSVRKFWNWAEEDGQRVLHLNGTIAEESWFDDDVTPEAFRKELMACNGPVTVYINSPGGDCIAASQIYTMLREFPHHVTVKIDALAASAASVIAMAGMEVLMAPTALMMLHNPATVAVGDHGDMVRAIEMLDSVKESIINAYQEKTGLDRKTISRMMEEETWMDAGKAIELGFADGIIGKANDHSGVLFSQKRVDNALVNKISGIPIQPFYDRLEKLR